MNLTAILDDLYRRLALPATPNPTETTRLTSFINTTHRQILGLPGLESLRDDTIAFSTVAGKARYGLPVAVMRIEGISSLTAQRKLQYRTQQELRAADPGLTGSGEPECYAVVGYQPLHTQQLGPLPELYVHSTAGEDISQEVHCDLILDGGAHFPCHVTLQGSVAVAVFTRSDLPRDVVDVASFSVSGPRLGIVGLWADPETTKELAGIYPGVTFSRYLGIQLYPTPASVTTYYVDYVRSVLDLQADDEPLLPIDFHWLLVEGALLKEWTKRDDDRRVAAEREYVKGLSALKYFVTCQADALPVSGQVATTHASRYGPYFPAMRG